jgi:hypothetical protein
VAFALWTHGLLSRHASFLNVSGAGEEAGEGARVRA